MYSPTLHFAYPRVASMLISLNCAISFEVIASRWVRLRPFSDRALFPFATSLLHTKQRSFVDAHVAIHSKAMCAQLVLSLLPRGKY